MPRYSPKTTPLAKASARQRTPAASLDRGGPDGLPWVGREMTLQLESVGQGGRSLARTAGGQVVFVDGGVPGQTVRVRVTACKSGYIEAERLELLAPAPDQAEPFCPHFGECGGCVWQEIPYQRQLEFKQAQILESLRRLGGLAEEEIAAAASGGVLPSPVLRGYRGKVELVFAAPLQREQRKPRGALKRPLPPQLGFRKLRSHAVVDIDSCPVADPRLPGLLAVVRHWAAGSGLTAYAAGEAGGKLDLSAILRFLVVRASRETGQAAVELITAPGPQAAKRIRELGKIILERCPWVVSFVHSVRRSASQTAQGEETLCSLGRPKLRESLAGFDYELSPAAFFQTNPSAAEIMLAEALRLLRPAPGEEIWDLYCGVGTFSLPLAGAGARVLGLEANAAAVVDAQANGKLNNLEHCAFLAGDVRELLRKLLRGGARRPAAVLADPPRAGMHPAVVESLRNLRPGRILLVSCHLATLARDVAALRDRYALEAVQGIDLFPYTAHVETLCLLTLRRD